MRAVPLTRLQRSVRVISLRIRNRCQTKLAALNRRRFRVTSRHDFGRISPIRGNPMEGKARFIFPVIISALIVFVVSAVVTFANIGLRADFVPRWLRAFVTGWPVAAVLVFCDSLCPPRDRGHRAIDRGAGLASHWAGLIPSVSPICLTVLSWSSSASVNSAGVPGFTTCPVAASLLSTSGSLTT